MSKYNPLTMKQIRGMQKKFQFGSPSAKYVAKVTNQLIKERNVANRRLRRLAETGNLDRRGVGAYTAKQILAYLGKTGQKTFGVPQDFDELLSQAGLINKFLNAEDSTLSGIKKIRNRNIENFRKGVLKDTRFENMTDEEIDEFLSMIKGQGIREYFQAFTRYDEEMEMMATLFQEDKNDFSDLLDLRIETFLDQQKWLESGMGDLEDYYNTHEGAITLRKLREELHNRYEDIRSRRR